MADLQLRGTAGSLRTRVHWPPALVEQDDRPLLVALPADGSDALWADVSALTGVVVLALSDARVTGVADSLALAEATTAVHWVADHAEELHADPRRLLVGGEGAGAWLAAAVALQARDEGWPSLIGHVLVVTATSVDAAGAPRAPGPLPGRSLAGVAPAIVATVGDGPHVVEARRYAARLRTTGVPVDEVRHDDPVVGVAACLAPTLRRSLDDEGAGPA